MRSPLDQLIYDATRGLADAPPGTKLIRLTKGFFAVVDDVDFEVLNAFKWQVKSQPKKEPYAARREYILGSGRDNRRDRSRRMHRDVIGAPAELMVDHINGNGLDNRRSNLRLCVMSQNAANCGKRSHNKTGFKGVSSATPGRYRAIVCVNGRNQYFGTYGTPEEAGLAYDRAATRLFGEFARLNFPGHQQVLSNAPNLGDGEHPCVEGVNPR